MPLTCISNRLGDLRDSVLQAEADVAQTLLSVLEPEPPAVSDFNRAGTRTDKSVRATSASRSAKRLDISRRLAALVSVVYCAGTNVGSSVFWSMTEP